MNSQTNFCYGRKAARSSCHLFFFLHFYHLKLTGSQSYWKPCKDYQGDGRWWQYVVCVGSVPMYLQRCKKMAFTWILLQRRAPMDNIRHALVNLYWVLEYLLLCLSVMEVPNCRWRSQQLVKPVTILPAFQPLKSTPSHLKPSDKKFCKVVSLLLSTAPIWLQYLLIQFAQPNNTVNFKYIKW